MGESQSEGSASESNAGILPAVPRASPSTRQARTPAGQPPGRWRYNIKAMLT
jgi:hypothetical protein